jgi:hypothetical protein
MKINLSFPFLFFEKINDIKDTCYGNATLDSAAHSGFSLEHLRLSLDSFQQSALDDKVTPFPLFSNCYNTVLFFEKLFSN